VVLFVDWQAVSREYLMESAARGDPRAAHILHGLLLDGRVQGHLDIAADEPVTVAVAVCTARRPHMLRHCLEAIAHQIVPRGVELHLVVVDNEAAPNNRQLVQRFSARCPFPVHYVHEPARGIPRARNAALEACRTLQARWIAFTDDDCWVNPGWIASLLDVANRYQADVIYGRREFILPPTYWAVPPDQPAFAEGQTLRSAATHNVLFSGWLIAEGKGDCLRFNEQLSHGEDTDFFYRASRREARIVYAQDPVVFEMVPTERATLWYQSRRAYYYAASRSFFHRRHKGAPRAFLSVLNRIVLKAPFAVARLGLAPIIWPFSEEAYKGMVLKGASRLAGIAGAAAGLLGRPGNPYETVD
jgi:succinoglycan biosynthesis protein ExoM